MQRPRTLLEVGIGENPPTNWKKVPHAHVIAVGPFDKVATGNGTRRYSKNPRMLHRTFKLKKTSETHTTPQKQHPLD